MTDGTPTNDEQFKAVIAAHTAWPLLGLAVAVMFLIGCAGGGRPYELTYEVRRSLSHPIPFDGNLEAVTQHAINGSHLKAAKRRVTDGYTVLEHGGLIYEDLRRAVVIKPAGEPAQVFVLAIPFMPKPADWSEWRKPDYADITPVPELHFMHGGRPKTDMVPVPENYFEMRYKLNRWDFQPNQSNHE